MAELSSILSSMGFETDQINAVVATGITSVDDAVAWLFSGSGMPAPAPASAAPTPHLVLDSSAVAASAPIAPPSLADPVAPVVSRTKRTAEQEALLESMRKKECATAEAVAIRRKKEDAASRARTLQQIKDDRAARQTARVSPVPPAADRPAPTTVAAPAAAPTATLLQIRLPNGQTLRQSFSVTVALDHVARAASHAAGRTVRLLQPFPRREFGSAESALTLAELGLSPRASLAAMPAEGGTGQGESSGEPEQVKMSTTPPAPQDEDEGQDQEDPITAAAAGMHVGSDGDDGDGDGDAEDDGHALPHPAFASGMPFLGGFAGHHPHPYAGSTLATMTGTGYRLGGGDAAAAEPTIDTASIAPTASTASLARDRQRAAAAAAAAKRAVPGASGTAQATTTTTRKAPTISSPSSLTDLCVSAVAKRIFATSNPILLLSGVNRVIGERLLEQMRKTGRLNAKVFGAFLPCGLDSINLRDYVHASDELCLAMRSHVCISEVNFQGCSTLTKEGIAHLSGLPALTKLNVGHCRFTDTVLPYIALLPNITDLTLDALNLSTPGMLLYLHSPAASRMQRLTLNECTRLTDDIIPALAKLADLHTIGLAGTQVTDVTALQSLPLLVRLNLARTRVDARAMDGVQQLKQLETLELQGTAVPGEALAALRSLPALRNLSLPARAAINDAAVAHVAALNLHTLSFRDCRQVTSAGVASLRGCTALQSLDLSNTGIDDGAMEAIATLTELTQLELERTAISDATAPFFAALTQLRTLNLSNTRITNHFLCVRALVPCTQLTTLSLANTAISDEGLVFLELPALQRLNLVGTDATEACRTRFPPSVALRVRAPRRAAEGTVATGMDGEDGDED